MYQLQILNTSTLASNAELAPIAAAQQIQISRDYVADYGAGIDAGIKLADHDDGVSFPIHVFDDDASAPAGALAWHTVDAQGRPYGMIPVAVIKRYGADLASCISHEVLELLTDPTVDRTAPAILYRVGPFNVPVSVAYETCDAVENDTYPIQTPLGTVTMSNYVRPAWFVQGSPGPWDKLGKVTGPLRMSPGGYLQYQLGGVWHTMNQGRLAAHRAIESYHCRRHRRARKAFERANPGHHALMGRLEAAAGGNLGTIATIIQIAQTLGPGVSLLLQELLQTLAQGQPSPPGSPVRVAPGH